MTVHFYEHPPPVPIIISSNLISLPVSNKWIHEAGQEFLRPCDPTETISKQELSWQVRVRVDSEVTSTTDLNWLPFSFIHLYTFVHYLFRYLLLFIIVIKLFFVHTIVISTIRLYELVRINFTIKRTKGCPFRYLCLKSSPYFRFKH